MFRCEKLHAMPRAVKMFCACLDLEAFRRPDDHTTRAFYATLSLQVLLFQSFDFGQRLRSSQGFWKSKAVWLRSRCSGQLQRALFFQFLSFFFFCQDAP